MVQSYTSVKPAPELMPKVTPQKTEVAQPGVELIRMISYQF